MIIFVYDKTFEGLLTVVFESYSRKMLPDKILCREELQDMLWSDYIEIHTDDVKAERVWSGLFKKLSADACYALHKVYLSEMQDIEMLIYLFIKKTFDTPHSIENDFGDKYVLEVSKIHKKVVREAQRILMFLRFQKTLDNIYFASFDPQYNVLPLAVNHFKERFADQQWVIFDTRRKFGFYYDLKKVFEVKLENAKIDFKTGKIDESALAEDEKLFQVLWKNYFDSMAIAERKNPRLHKQMLPKRFWKYLPEKNVM